jgi:hypothetical protein
LADWWAARLEDRLSQGDILQPCPVGGPAQPPKFLRRGSTRSGGVNIWEETPTWTADPDGVGIYLGRGRRLASIVLTHSCELDKPGTGRVLIAPISPVDVLAPQHREDILAQRKLAFLPLPDLPTLGTCYADLRCVLNIDRKLAESEKRTASMTEDGRRRLHAQLIGFFARVDL